MDEAVTAEQLAAVLMLLGDLRLQIGSQQAEIAALREQLAEAGPKP